MYNTLFVNFIKATERTVVFTQIGNHTQHSADYRWSVYKKWVDLPIDQSRGFFIDCKDYDECRHLQRTFHEVMKPWITENCIISLNCKLSDKVFRTILTRLLASFDSEDRHSIRAKLMEAIMRVSPIESRPGYIYLLRIKGKLKIGLTNDIKRRKEELKSKYNTDIDVVDLKRTDTMEYDEAMLHLYCSTYKSVNNNLGEQKVDESYCSELYNEVPEVEEIWKKYWRYK